jgi:hypothetical protein
MAKLESRRFEEADESHPYDGGRVDIIALGDVILKRGVSEPGFSWSGSLKEMAGTSHCEIPHTSLIVSGCQGVRMKDGTEAEFRAGEIAVIPAGHDVWVVGDEPCVSIDISSVERYDSHELPFHRAAPHS